MKSVLILVSLLFALTCYSQENDKENRSRVVVVNLTDSLRVPELDREYVINDISPRYQWNSNSGYCGEVSMISAGLYYGQYVSQFHAREIISGKDQINGEMLLGVNDAILAHSLRLKYDTIQTQDSKAFLKWVKKHVIQGHPVIIGVMDDLSNDSNYDHIVPVIGIGSSHALTVNDEVYRPKDVILFSDNGLMTVNTLNPAIPLKGNAKYYYHQTFKHFLGSRKQANSSKKDYTLVKLPNKIMSDSIYNYAIAILGVSADDQEKTYPVSISTNFNYEAPTIINNSNICPNSMSLELTVTVSGLTPGTKYCLYQYGSEKEVPRKDFNNKSNRHKERTEFTLSSGKEFSLSLNIQSDEKVFFRCVEAE